MIDLWQEIYGTIKRNKLRTFLTGFAVAWGIFMLIVLLGAGNGIIHAFEQNASERALNSIRIFPGWTTKSYDGLKEGRFIQLDNRDMDDTEKQFTENVISAGATVRQSNVKTFNRITVDGDTSTNDTCVVLANGLAGNTPITGPGADYDTFFAALRHVCEYEAKMIASDGEGAGRLVTCTVQGAETEEQAEQMAKAVVRSPLVKCAMFGTDANWVHINSPFRLQNVEKEPYAMSIP